MNESSLFPSLKQIKKRYRAERRFRFYGVAAILIGCFCLLVLLSTIVHDGWQGFYQTNLSLPIYMDPQIIDPHQARGKDPKILKLARYDIVILQALQKELKQDPQADKTTLKELKEFISGSARFQLRDEIVRNPALIGKTVQQNILASSVVDLAAKGKINLHVKEGGKLSAQQIHWLQDLQERGRLVKKFNTALFLNAGSSRPESAGLAAGFIGSFYMLLTVLGFSVPIGVATAVFLEEYAKKSRWIDVLEVNINNLAAVPSIIFGLLGLGIFINLLGMPRSASLVGGLVLALISLPTIIISTRSALRAVPPSIRAAALGLGASKTQAIFHHVLPLAAPGILTGIIISLAQSLGQTAPLLLIGMVAFVVDYPISPLDPATALPVQIYIWTNEVDRAFTDRSFAAIIVLVLLLLIINVIAFFLRRRFTRRW